MSHDHPRGADLDWYREHLAEEHNTFVGDFSRATVMRIHADTHALEDEAEANRLRVPFHDRRPVRPRVIERQRPRRDISPAEQEFLDASSSS